MEEPGHDLSQHILANLPMAMVITDDAGLVLWCNQTLSRWLDCAPGQCVGRTELALLGKHVPVGQRENSPASNGPFVLGQSQPGVDRRVLRCPLPAKDEQYIVCYIDISEEEALRKDRHQLAQQLAQHNTVDPLSGLLNNQALDKGLEPLVSRSRRYQNPLSVVTMEVINMDDVTQSLGQVAADKMVVSLSQFLRDQMRWADMVGRLNTGQFMFILPETNRDAAMALANKLVTQLKEFSIQVDDQTSVQPTVCFGVTAWEKGDDARLLTTRSKEAASTARSQGAFAVQTA
ncbi:MAG TPA: sensor domain-containing diguanylate cyclase [Gammaproteobacteria bacterium]|nr:sensor domain-containing diguanylate cyclase [Gammaproteobacteria bacterium]